MQYLSSSPLCNSTITANTSRGLKLFMCVCACVFSVAKDFVICSGDILGGEPRDLGAGLFSPNFPLFPFWLLRLHCFKISGKFRNRASGLKLVANANYYVGFPLVLGLFRDNDNIVLK